MPKRRKHPRLPNGYGTIKHLSGNRLNPYAVYGPAKEYNLNGNAVLGKAICYVDDWYKGFAVLTAMKAGTYYPGMELELDLDGEENLSKFTKKILANYARYNSASYTMKRTFSDVYEEYYNYKYVNTSKEYSKSALYAASAAYKNCSALHDRDFSCLRLHDLQGVVDDCKKSHATKEFMVTLIKGMYSYALATDMIDKDYSQLLKINTPDDDEHGVPFTEDDIRKLWTLSSEPVAEMLLIMCYSGYRISAYGNITVNLDEKYFQGGVKTKSSKNRIVPIHSCIMPLVEARMNRYGSMLNYAPGNFRIDMQKFLSRNGMDPHTPHDCRHTFSFLCEKYGVNENDRIRMLGHSFKTVTNSVYGHRDVEDLRTEIEKIPCLRKNPCC